MKFHLFLSLFPAGRNEERVRKQASLSGRPGGRFFVFASLGRLSSQQLTAAWGGGYSPLRSTTGRVPEATEGETEEPDACV